MWARRIEDRKRDGVRRWRETTAAERLQMDVSEAVARRAYAVAHERLNPLLALNVHEDALRLAERLGSPRLSLEEKQDALLLLAHQPGIAGPRQLLRYLENPDARLVQFAALAWEEASRIQREGGCAFDKRGPCLCGSARKLKDCCGRRS
ncbi:MAG: SEC-C metal-binding domain-containing protein [Myxococcales bacterium]